MNEENKNKKRKIEFPKDFFSIPRPTITFKEVLEDVTPIEWEEKSKDIVIHSAKENKTL